MKGTEIKELRRRVEATRTELQDMQTILDTEEKKCPHDWGEPRCVPEYKKGYHIPPRGAGSDFQSGLDVPAETTKKWSRECKLCGKVQETKHIKKQKKEIPAF